ncbi:PstS family phosphate ABC transporter substrate-binding protein [Ornithinibacillus contaminans]|uniref:PstS family phosphate ABC transporter substrate-binding protein n=1 Tax=Ornithinibacillus contaminans TaxID=694055 RepID=UPI00064DB61D|nr:substrate-binding domain-containing protein [Ornithinibacillus contaminans]
MNANIGVRILLFLLVSGVIAIFAFIACIIIVLFGSYKFYIPFIIFITIGILFAIFNGFFKVMNRKLQHKVVIIYLVIAILSIVIHEGINLYEKGLPTLSNTEVDLSEYQPFAKDSNAVKLDETASFKIEGNPPIMDGATALYPVYAAFAQATYPEKEYDAYDSEVKSSKTPYAYDNLINGKVDMIFAAAPSPNQLQKAEDKGIELKLTPIGKEAFVFFVNARNPIEELQLDEIKGIYSGEITNWREVGGKNDSIRAFQRPADSGSQTTLEQLMGNTPIMEAPHEDVVNLMEGIIEETAAYKNYKNAIGYTFRFFSNEMLRNNLIRHLAIDGVQPTVETIRSGEYPLTSEFYVVTAGSDNPNVEPFIDWILSDEGQSIIEDTGYVPISESGR